MRLLAAAAKLAPLVADAGAKLAAAEAEAAATAGRAEATAAATKKGRTAANGGSTAGGGAEAQAEAFRLEGNNAFKSGDFKGAILGYSKAIGLDPKNSVLFSNRAMAYLKVRWHVGMGQ